MPSSHDCEADVVRMRKRHRRTMAAVACGAFLLIVAGMIAALVAADRRAVQAFDGRPRIARDGRPPVASRPTFTTAAAALMQVEPPGSTAALDAMRDAQESLDGRAHHGRKRHGRRFAHWRSHGHGGLFGFFAGR
jgi:hypothetical protein